MNSKQTTDFVLDLLVVQHLNDQLAVLLSEALAALACCNLLDRTTNGLELGSPGNSNDAHPDFGAFQVIISCFTAGGRGILLR